MKERITATWSTAMGQIPTSIERISTYIFVPSDLDL